MKIITTASLVLLVLAALLMSRPLLAMEQPPGWGARIYAAASYLVRSQLGTLTKQEKADQKWEEMLRLCQAQKKHYAHHLSILLRDGADVNLHTTGRTMLYFAAWVHDPEAVRILLQAGANPYIYPEHPSYPPLLKALCFWGSGYSEFSRYRMTMQRFLQSGIDVDWPTINSCPALLHVAKFNSHYEPHSLLIVSLLLDAGANRAITDRKGRNTANLAIKYGYQELFELLTLPSKIA